MKTCKIVSALVCASVLLCGIPMQAEVQTAETVAEQTTEVDFLIPVEQKTEVPEGYIAIYTAEDLDNVRNDLDANYILMNDIDLSEYENWEPIGDITHESTYGSEGFFSGIFDGNGFDITNLNMNVSSSYQTDNTIWEYYGLFSMIYGEDTLIENVSLLNVSITMDRDVACFSRTNIGAIAGGSMKGTIRNCVIAGGNISLTNYGEEHYYISAGSAVGDCSGNLFAIATNVDIIFLTQIENDTLRYTHGIGGIVGVFTSSDNEIRLENCINYSTIQCDGGTSDVGGIVGRCAEYNDAHNSICNCINYASIYVSVSGYSGLSGIIGSVDLWDESELLLENCANYGIVSSTGYCNYVGGIVGELYSGSDATIVNMFGNFNSGNILIEEYDVVGHVGGLIGLIKGYYDTLYDDGLFSTIIIDSYNSGKIICQYPSVYLKAGGLFGDICSASVELYRCYSMNCLSAVNTSVAQFGVIVGEISDSYFAIENCYYEKFSEFNWVGTVENESETVEGNCVSLSDTEMQDASSFVGFDFDTVWEIGVTDGYPYPTLRDNPHIGSKTLWCPTLIVTPGSASTQTHFDWYITPGLTDNATGFYLEVYDETNSLYPTTITANGSTMYTVTMPQSPGNYTATLYAIYEDGTRIKGNTVRYTVESAIAGNSTVVCNNSTDYAGNYRSFTVTFDQKPTSAYLQFDNQNDAAKWLDADYCANNVLFRIDPTDIVEKDGKFVYTTGFRIHSEGLASENHMRKVRVVADYSGTTAVSEARSFQVNPIPERNESNTIGVQYQQTSVPDSTTDKPVIKNVANHAGTNGGRILSVLNYTCDDDATPFFWWKSDCGTFYKISNDFTKVGFIPKGSGTVTVYMGDGLGYVTSYVLTMEN